MHTVLDGPEVMAFRILDLVDGTDLVSLRRNSARIL